MQIPILKTMKKLPGGIMVVPLLLGAFINTFFPHALTIGGFTQALFKDGAQALIGMFLFCMGSQISIKQAGTPIKRGFIALITKFTNWCSYCNHCWKNIWYRRIIWYNANGLDVCIFKCKHWSLCRNS